MVNKLDPRISEAMKDIFEDTEGYLISSPLDMDFSMKCTPQDYIKNMRDSLDELEAQFKELDSGIKEEDMETSIELTFCDLFEWLACIQMVRDPETLRKKREERQKIRDYLAKKTE